ncbi:MAG: nucleotidyltransferase family protein [Bacteroidia bacterium]|jgi:molybdenum cofactor cytidylyltransferase|nr:nucleotidyltransferase family protein [Bacteroidia bacterium]
MSDIWAIILAAGESKRMKVPKMILPFKGKTIIEKVIENVTDSEVDKTLVVLGSDKDDILKIISHLPVMHCYNENYKQGMLSSVKCGFRFLPQKFRAALVFLGDQPMIEPDVINMVISAYRTSAKGIIIPVFRNKHGHPLLLDSKYRDEVEMLKPDETLRALTHKFSDDVFEVEANTHDILKDIDTKNDYLKELKQTK